MKKAHEGFVLVFTTLIISMSVLLISLVINEVNAYRYMSTLLTMQEKARLVAMGGIEIGIAQLASVDQKAKEAKEAKTPGAQTQQTKKESRLAGSGPAESPLVALLQLLNQWQTFTLKEEVDGIDAECKVYITSEHGKFNVAQWYDAKEKKFVNIRTLNGQKAAEVLTELLRRFFERRHMKPVEFGKLITNYYKTAKHGIDDITQLFTSKEFAAHSDILFPHPDKKGITLTDLCTVFTEDPFITPLLFSQSTQQLLGLNNPSKERWQDAGEKIEAVVKQKNINWQQAWKTVVGELYGKDYTSLPEAVRSLLSPQFEPNIFSVVSYAKVGAFEQGVLAVIVKQTKPASDESSADDNPYSIATFYVL